MNRQELLARKEEVHRIFQEIRHLKNNSIQMQRDLRSFDDGIFLLLNGMTYRECCELQDNFSTVYGWIKRGTLPLSFRQSATRTKETPTGLTKRKQFAYLLGVYQSKVDEIDQKRLTIITRDSELEKAVKQSLNALRLKHSQTTVHYANRSAEKIYYDSKNLMSRIKSITENNTSIPQEFIPNQTLMISYLQGFFDSRAIPSYSSCTIQSSEIRRIHPRIIITKSGNESLLSAVNTALHLLGINSRYNPRQTPDQIVINELESIKKVIDYKLFRNKEKLRELKETYRYWKETKKYDSNGKFQQAKNKIREER